MINLYINTNQKIYIDLLYKGTLSISISLVSLVLNSGSILVFYFLFFKF